METGVQSIGRVNIMGRQGQYVAVDLHTIPVRRNDGVLQGATVLLHDVSSETSLEEKCQALHAQVAKDPLTQVANRAEFDRMLNNFVAAHQESQLPCSLIMCDIDHFKSINDTYGHQAGDAAIITFAALLEINVPLRRPGRPLRRRRVRHPVRRLHQRLGRPQGRSDSPEPLRARTLLPRQQNHHGQLRRHRTANRRYAGNHAAPRRSRTAPGQGPRPQPGRSIRRRYDRRQRRRRRVGGHSKLGAAMPWPRPR